MTNEIQATREKKKQLLKQIKYTKEEKEEAEEYLRLQEEYVRSFLSKNQKHSYQYL